MQRGASGTPPDRGPEKTPLKDLAKRVWHHVVGTTPPLDAAVAETIDKLLAEPEAYKGYRFLGRLFIADWAKKSAIGLLETLPANERTGPQVDLVARLAVRVAKRQVDATQALLMSGAIGLGASAAVAFAGHAVPYLWAQPVLNFLGGLFVGGAMARANDALGNMIRAFNYRLQFESDGIPEAYRDELIEIFVRVQTVDGRPLGPRGDVVNYSLMSSESLQAIAMTLTDARDATDAAKRDDLIEQASRGLAGKFLVDRSLWFEYDGSQPALTAELLSLQAARFSALVEKSPELIAKVRMRTLELIDAAEAESRAEAERETAAAVATTQGLAPEHQAPHTDTPPSPPARPEHGDLGLFARVALDGLFGNDPSAPAVEPRAEAAVAAPAPLPERRNFLARFFKGDAIELEGRTAAAVDALLLDPATLKDYPKGSSLIVRRWARIAARDLLNDVLPKERTPQRIAFIAYQAVRTALNEIERTRALLISAGLGVATMASVSYVSSLMPYQKVVLPVLNFLGGLAIGNSMARANDQANAQLRAASYSLGTTARTIRPALLLDFVNTYLRVQRVNGLALSQRGDTAGYDMMMHTTAVDAARYLREAAADADVREARLKQVALLFGGKLVFDQWWFEFDETQPTIVKDTDNYLAGIFDELAKSSPELLAEARDKICDAVAALSALAIKNGGKPITQQNIDERLKPFLNRLFCLKGAADAPRT